MPTPRLHTFVVVVTLALSLTASAQDTTGVGAISGTVTDARSAPVENAAVCVQATGQCAVTDETGTSRITDVRAGRYRLETIAPSQAPIVTEELDVRAGLSSTVEVVLPEFAGLQQTVQRLDPERHQPPELRERRLESPVQRGRGQ